MDLGRSRKLLLTCILLTVLCWKLIEADFIANPKPRMKGLEDREAILKTNSIKGSNAKKQDYELEVKKGDANTKLSGGSKVYDANAANNRASAKGAGGKEAIGTKIGSGGTYETPKNKGSYRNSQQGNDKVVNLESNQKAKLDVSDKGKEQDFTAVGNKHKYEADPNDNDYKQGILKRDDKPFNYKFNKGEKGGQGSASLADPSQQSIFIKGKNYTCTGQASGSGVSNCYDERGFKVGEVRVDKDGNAVLTNNLGIPLFFLKVTTDRTGKKTAVVNGGLLQAESVKQSDGNCPGFTNDKVKFSKPTSFEMESQTTSDGGKRWAWPACFKASMPLTLGTGILAKNICFKWTPLVLPAGRLNCQDPATIASGAPVGQCFYCGFCDPVKQAKAKWLGNTQSNICDAKGGQAYVASVTICPPPEVNMANYCDHFSKGLGDPYWNKQGDLDVLMEVIHRKSDQDYASVKADRVKYNQLLTNFKKENPKYLLSWNVPDSEVSEWYKTNQSEKIGCRRTTLKYTLGGSKANVGFMLEAGTAMTAFNKNPCPAPKLK